MQSVLQRVFLLYIKICMSGFIASETTLLESRMLKSDALVKRPSDAPDPEFEV